MLQIYAANVMVASVRKNLMEDHPLAQFAPSFGLVQAAFNQSAANLVIDIYSGTTLVVARLVPLVKATAPIFPEDFVVNFAIAPGEQIVFDALEEDAATPTLLWAMRFIPA